MGYLVNDRCVSTLQEAAEGACAEYPVVGLSGTDPVTASCLGVVSSGAALSIETVTGSASGVAITQSIAFGACDPLAQYADASLLWGLLVGAAALVWITKQFFWRLTANQ